MTFEEKLDRVIVLLECLLEDKARTVGFNHVATTLDIPIDVKQRSTDEKSQDMAKITPKNTQNDIRQLVAHLKNKGHNSSDLKEVLNKNGYTAISDIEGKDIDKVYNCFLSLS